MIAEATAIILYLLGCVTAHEIYTIVDNELERQGLQFAKWAFIAHVVFWPLVVMFSLLRKDTETNGLD